MDPFVRLHSLTKIYHGRGLLARRRRALRAVDRVSFEIGRRQVFGLVGESGCGKTSLARALLYLDPPTEGEVWIDGTLLGELPARALRAFRRRMQIVFQDPNSALNPKLRIEDSLAEGLVNLGVPAAERRRRIGRLLEMVGIADGHRRRYPHEFSGGQKQRLVVARALSTEPDFLVLDEPVSNLDVSIQAQIINLLMDLKAELALTYLFISHDLNLVAYLSDRIGVMYRGRLVELGDTAQIMAARCHPYTRKLFSSVPGRQPSPAAAAAAHQRRPETPAGRTSASAGCPYAEECEAAAERCGTERPELHPVSEGHLVACWLAQAQTPAPPPTQPPNPQRRQP